MSQACMQYRNKRSGTPTDDEIAFCELVGDLSEGVDRCSYNDDAILSYLLSGTLNEACQRSDDTVRLEGLTGHPVDYDYEAEMYRLMELTGGWPIDWYTPVVPLKELPVFYRSIFERNGKMDLIEKWSK